MGWAGLKGKHAEQVETALREFYIGFFNGDSRVTFLFPEENAREIPASAGYYSQICPNCLTLNSMQRKDGCSSCGEETLVTVLVPDNGQRHPVLHVHVYIENHVFLRLSLLF